MEKKEETLRAALLSAAAVAWSASVCSLSATQNSEPFSGSGFSPFSSCSLCSSCSLGADLPLLSGAGVEGVDGVDGVVMLGVGGVRGPLASRVGPFAGE